EKMPFSSQRLSAGSGSIEITHSLRRLSKGSPAEYRFCGLVRPRLCRMPDYAAPSVNLTLKEPLSTRHNFGCTRGADNGLFGRCAGSRSPDDPVIPIVALHPESPFRLSVSLRQALHHAGPERGLQTDYHCWATAADWPS